MLMLSPIKIQVSRSGSAAPCRWFVVVRCSFVVPHTLLHMLMCGWEGMPTNLAIDDALIEEAKQIGQHKTKKDAVTAALKEYIAHRKRIGLYELFGKIDYYPDYDHKELRRKKRH